MDQSPNVRLGQVMPEDFVAARAAGACPVDAGNQRPYGAAATAMISAFEGICANNTHVLYQAANEVTALIPPHMLSKHPGLKPPQVEGVSVFQSAILPAMSLLELATMLRRNTRCDKSTLCAAAILMIRFCEMSNLKPTLHMMHRMLIGALQVATKAHSDEFLRNDVAGQLCGMKPAELSRLEVLLLTGCQCRLQVSNAEACDVAAATIRAEALCLATGSFASLYVAPCVESDGSAVLTSTAASTPSTHSTCLSDSVIESDYLPAENVWSPLADSHVRNQSSLNAAACSSTADT